MKLVAKKSFFISGFGDVVPGQTFDIADRHAKVLKALGKARDLRADPEPEPQRFTRVVPRESVDAAPEPEPEPVAPAASGHPDDLSNRVLTALRARATAMGIKIDGRWGEDRLREEITAAQKERERYQRRDLRAEG